MRLSRQFIWIISLSLLLGALLSFLQGGSWLVGWLSFSFLLFLSITLLVLSTRWAGAGRVLSWMVALAFALRLGGGVVTYLLLPVAGFNEPDDQAGFVFTDSHRRDAQAWDLAVSEHPILDAFNEKYAYDQYGGLLAFSAMLYRTLSPDAHRPLLLVIISALAAALGLPFLWKSARQKWGDKVALAAGWIYALYPESVLLGGSAMREPYLMGLSAFALWGFVDWHELGHRRGWAWIGVALAGMLLVSPAVAIVTLLILGGWFYFSGERRSLPWWVVAAAAAVFILGLFVLSSALDPNGSMTAVTPFGVVNNWLRLAVKWDMYQLERSSGRVQLIFDQLPQWLRLPFVVGYGIFQPVLPAVFLEPTTLLWRVIGIVRAAGWYVLLPVLCFAILQAGRLDKSEDRRIWVWFTVAVWGWILLAALRGG
ncbi:MAG TPA: glycosyltransferase family 39 protein, partial [Anaerolineales bacterium]